MSTISIDCEEILIQYKMESTGFDYLEGLLFLLSGETLIGRVVEVVEAIHREVKKWLTSW